MAMSMDNPKLWVVGGILYLFFMIVLWKFQMGTSTIDLTKIRIIASVVFLPVCFGIVYMMGDD